MLFPTFTFALFFLIVFALSWANARHLEWHKIILLLASWIFYGWWDFRFVALLIASGVLNWGAAQMIVKAIGPPRKRIFVAGVVLNLAILGLFKYYGFFIEQLSASLTGLGWQRDLPVLDIVLPVGVSFFTFQGMSYLIDIYRGTAKPARLLDTILLMSFFPHLVAGPIVRASHLIPQLEAGPKLTRGMASAGFVLIIWGLFKKAVIASELATRLVDPVFLDPAAHSGLDLAIAAYGYAVQIYCDFSAYSDMAIGLAALLGYRFPRNFDQPYRATTLQDFWRRWHISLSNWLRDYLYVSLGGSRNGVRRMYVALVATMLLGGLWHGASWNFIIWGALHGGMLVAERLWRAHRPAGWPVLPDWAGVIVTFHMVTLAWIFFRCASFADAVAYLRGLGGLAAGAGFTSPYLLALIAVGLALHAGPADLAQRIAARLSMLRVGSAAAVVTVAMLVVDAMRPEGVAKFIYYQF